MKVIKTVAQFFVISIFFGTFVGCNALANPLCGSARFAEPSFISENLVISEVADYKFEILQKQNNIDNLFNKLSQNNFLVTFSQDAETTNSSKVPGLGKPSKTSSISLTHSLNFYQKNIKKRLLEEQIKLEKTQLLQLKSKRQISKLKMIVELAQANNLDLLYNERQSLIEEQIKYYSALREAGKPDFDKELLAKSEATTNRDKIFANSIVINELKQKLSLDETNSNLVKINHGALNIIADDVCKLENVQILNLSIEVKVSQIELESLAFDRNFELNFESSISSQFDRKGGNSNQAQASIVFSKKLYDGKQTENERRGLRSNINLKKKQIKEIIASSRNDMILRKNKEKVLITSLKSIRAEIQGIDNRIEELEQRQNLGQTVFLEITSNRKEKLRLQESAQRITTDFIIGWYDFLSNRRQNDV